MSKKSKFCKVLFSLAMCMAFFYSLPSAQAALSPLAFKNVTRHFKKDKKIYSPTLAAIARDSFVEGLRFFGPYQSGGVNPETGETMYVKDKGDDPVMRLLIDEFRSPAGHLGAVTDAGNNFARYINHPHILSTLTNFEYDVRYGSSEKRETIKQKTLQKMFNIYAETEHKKDSDLLQEALEKTFHLKNIKEGSPLFGRKEEDPLSAQERETLANQLKENLNLKGCSLSDHHNEALALFVENLSLYSPLEVQQEKTLAQLGAQLQELILKEGARHSLKQFVAENQNLIDELKDYHKTHKNQDWADQQKSLENELITFLEAILKKQFSSQDGQLFFFQKKI
jgi:hypothetical protein